MQAPVEIRYAGVVMGRAQEVRNVDAEFFLPVRDPMPVGSVVRLQSGDGEFTARVVRAVESADTAICGMQVRLIGEAEIAATDWIPAPLVTAARPKPATHTPVAEVDLSAMRDNAASPAPAAAAAPAAEAEAVPEAIPVPEAVPTTVGSSLTGALEKATASPITENNEAATEAAASDAAGGTPGDTLDEATDDNSASEASDTEPATDDMPAARPIAGPSGRRKTKRRRNRCR
jgi:hypothetical protein